MYSKHQRFEGIKRNYTPETVEKLRGSLKIEYTLAKRGTMKLWNYLTRGGNSYINAMGALTGKRTLPCSQPTNFDGGSFDLTARERHSLSLPNMVNVTMWRAICLGVCPNKFDMLHFENWNAFTTLVRYLINKSSKIFLDSSFHGHVNLRNSNDVEIHRNEQMNFGPWRKEAMETDVRCDSTTFHSISLQQLRMYVKAKPQWHNFRSGKQLTVQRSSWDIYE